MKKELLTGRAKFNISRNDMFWKCIILDTEEGCEFFDVLWSGYNDTYWWDNVSRSASVATCTGDKGTVKKFKLDYETLDVVEVE